VVLLVDLVRQHWFDKTSEALLSAAAPTKAGGEADAP
jgi:hypothetical protein